MAMVRPTCGANTECLLEERRQQVTTCQRCWHQRTRANPSLAAISTDADGWECVKPMRAGWYCSRFTKRCKSAAIGLLIDLALTCNLHEAIQEFLRRKRCRLAAGTQAACSLLTYG